ncbi:MAG: hypothetical protein HW414_823 [Dehalococcoidia bacterium]|nr:hypothetical protein [Dehalococcoidia bacterium]
MIGHLRKTLITGLLLLVPLIVTYVVLRLVFFSLDGVLQPGFERLFGVRVPGVGLIALLVLMYFIGLLGLYGAGKQLIRLGQRALLGVPVIGMVYSAARQLIESFSGTGQTGFKRVVAIEYPKKGTWAIGFLTGLTSDGAGKSMALIYIPTAPTPNSGWVALLAMEDVYDVDMTVSDAFRLVLSGGIQAPPAIRMRPLVL